MKTEKKNVKENLGEGDSLREEEITADEDGEEEVSKVSEEPEVPRMKVSKGKATPQKMQMHVPK